MRFEDLIDEKRDVPQRRKVQDLQRSTKKIKGEKKYSSSSMSSTSFGIVSILTTLILALLVVAALGYGIYLGINAYTS